MLHWWRSRLRKGDRDRAIEQQQPDKLPDPVADFLLPIDWLVSRAIAIRKGKPGPPDWGRIPTRKMCFVFLALILAGISQSSSRLNMVLF